MTATLTSEPAVLGQAQTLQFDLFGDPIAPDALEPAVTADVIDAAPLLAPQGKVPRLLRKPNAAIHIHILKGRYTHIMRRAFNGLLYLSRKRLAELAKVQPNIIQDLVQANQVMKFQARGVDLKVFLGQEDRNDYMEMYEALSSLTSMRVAWDAMDTDGRIWTNMAGMLSQWGRDPETGNITWLWVPDLFEMLFDPDAWYTQVDIPLTLKFKSVHTASVYETCWRYANMKAEAPRSHRRPTRDWVLLLVGAGVYREYKDFKRYVLVPAIKELNGLDEFPFTVELDEKFGPKNNKVESFQFVLHRKLGQVLQPDPLALSLKLDQKLREIGVHESELNRLLAQEDPSHLQIAYEYTKKKLGQGKVDNPGGFFMSALRKKYEDHEVAREALEQARIEKARIEDAKLLEKAQKEREAAASVRLWFTVQPSAVQEALLARFEATLKDTGTLEKFRTKGLKAVSIESQFMGWLKKQAEYKRSFKVKNELALD